MVRKTKAISKRSKVLKDALRSTMVYFKSFKSNVNLLKTSVYRSCSKDRDFRVCQNSHRDLSSSSLNRERIGCALIALIWLRNDNASVKRSHTNVFTTKLLCENPIYIRTLSLKLAKLNPTKKLSPKRFN